MEAERREFLKVGAGFSAALAVAGAFSALAGCSEAPKVPAKNFSFLTESDLALFGALIPSVVLEVATLDPAERERRVAGVLTRIDGTCVALGSSGRQELRKLFDLLSNGPLRYILTGVGSWSGASVETVQNFLARWRGSRFATLNAGGNVLVKLVATSYYIQPATWRSAGYPGPLEHLYKAVNS